MDLWKLLILGLILVGLVLVLWAPPELPKLPAGLRIEEGTFRITENTETREELFGIYPVEAGFRLVSIVHVKGTIFVEADLVFSRDFSPLLGTITQRRPQEARWIFTFSGEEVLIRKQEGIRETAENVKVLELTFPFDREIIGTWKALFRAAPFLEEIQLLDIRKNTVQKAQIQRHGETFLSVLGRATLAERFTFVFGEERLVVFRQGELLIGVLGEDFQAYLVEILPEGIKEL